MSFSKYDFLDKIKLYKQKEVQEFLHTYPKALSKMENVPGGIKYENAPYEGATSLALSKLVLPISLTTDLMARKDMEATPKKPLYKGMMTSAGIGAIALPLASTAIYLYGKGGMKAPVGPVARHWATQTIARAMGGAVVGGGSYAASRGVEKIIKEKLNNDEH